MKGRHADLSAMHSFKEKLDWLINGYFTNLVVYPSMRESIFSIINSYNLSVRKITLLFRTFRFMFLIRYFKVKISSQTFKWLSNFNGWYEMIDNNDSNNNNICTIYTAGLKFHNTTCSLQLLYFCNLIFFFYYVIDIVSRTRDNNLDQRTPT